MASKITIYGQEYHLTDEIENYVKVRKDFQVLSEKYEKMYEKELESKCTDAAMLVKNAYDIADKYFDKAGEIILNKLVENEIYTVQLKNIKEYAIECGALTTFDDVFESVENAYYGIVQTAQSERIQRKERKDSRTRLVGGGFGLTNAMRGIIEAEMVNTATGLGYSVINAWGNAKTEQKMNEKLMELYYMGSMRLHNALRRAISNYYAVMMIVLNEYNLVSFDWPSEEDEEKAKAILENLEANRIPQNKMESVAYNLITLNPYNAHIYSCILKNLGDADNELEAFGQAHGIDVKRIKDGIIEVINDKINKICNKYKTEGEPILLEKKLLELQTEIEKQKSNLGIKKETECEKLIKKELNGLNEKYKTVDGILFSTIEEARLAEKDLKKFYDYISVNGIESELIGEELEKLEFNTTIVTGNLQTRLEEMKLLKDDKELGKRIASIFNKHGFSPNSGSFANKTFIIESTKKFAENEKNVRNLAEIPNDEKVVLIFKKEKKNEDEFIWWVLSTNNLYTFENKDKNIIEKKVVNYLDIDFIHADSNGNLITRIKGGVDRISELELSGKGQKSIAREKLSHAMQEVYYLIAPLSKRCLTSGKVGNSKPNTVELNLDDLKQLALNKSLNKEDKNHVCVNNGSQEFKTLLLKAKQYWEYEFEDEQVYLVMIDSKIGSSVVLTNKRCYIYGKVYSTIQKYVLPVEKISSFGASGTKKEYNLFFDVEYFKENYFNCSSEGVCFNTIEFNMFNISEYTGRAVCDTLNILVTRICQPLREKERKKEYFENAIKDISDGKTAQKIVDEIKKDNILDDDDREIYLQKAQFRLDKYNNSAANKQAMEELLSTIKKDDIKTINQTINGILNQMLSNEFVDENDKNIVVRLITMQLDRGGRVYRSEINRFFGDNDIKFLLTGKKIYTSEADVDLAEKLFDFYNKVQLNLEEDEVPVLFFAASRLYSLGGDAVASLERGYLFTNKRAVIPVKPNAYKYYALDDLIINADDIERGYNIRDGKGEPIPFVFPYRKVDDIDDKIYRKWVKKQISESEATIVARELRTFISRVHQKQQICPIEKEKNDAKSELRQKQNEAIQDETAVKMANLDDLSSKDTKKPLNELKHLSANPEKNLLTSKVREKDKNGQSDIHRKEEYELLRPFVEPIMPVIQEHVSYIKEEWLDYRIMKWDGEPEIIQGEKAPILAVLRDTNCVPALMGERAINTAGIVLSILPDYFYLLNKEKFILYIKGQKNEWKISNIQKLSFKDGFVSSSLLITDNMGRQETLKIDSSFYKHVDGLNKIIAFLRSDNSTMSSNNMAQNRTVSQNMKNENHATETDVSMTNAVHSFSEMVDYVNKLPNIEDDIFIGKINPKFSKKIKKAINAYASTVAENQVFALYDDTLFGSGKEGFVMTMNELIMKVSFNDTFRCTYSDIRGFKILYTDLYVDTKFGSKHITGWRGEKQCEALANHINEIVKYLYNLENAPYYINHKTIS